MRDRLFRALAQLALYGQVGAEPRWWRGVQAEAARYHSPDLMTAMLLATGGRRRRVRASDPADGSDSERARAVCDGIF